MTGDRLTALALVRRDRSFRRLWLAHAVTTAGSWVSFVVLPLFVYQLTGSPLQTALLSVVQFVPYPLFGLVAGAVADRSDRRRLMIGSELASGVALGSVPLAAAFDALTLPHVYLVGFLATSFYVWFDAADFGAVPAIAGKQNVVEAQSAIYSTATFLGIIAPSVGGLLAAVVGAANAVALDATTYGVSALLILSIRRPFATDVPEPLTEPIVRRTVRDIREGLSFLWSQQIVRTLTLLGFGVSFSGGAMSGLLVVYAVQALGFSDRGGAVGVLFSAVAAGTLLGSLALPRLARRIAPTRITLWALPVDTVLLLGVACAPGLGAALALLLAWSLVQMTIILNGITLRQRVTPDRLQGRVNVTARMIAWGGTPFGALVGGVIADRAGVRVALAAVAGGVAASAVAAWLTPPRTASVPSDPSEAAAEHAAA
jgi:MFS family permease